MIVPRNIQEALDDPNWKVAVMEEMNALKRSGTWELVDFFFFFIGNDTKIY